MNNLLTTQALDLFSQTREVTPCAESRWHGEARVSCPIQECVSLRQEPFGRTDVATGWHWSFILNRINFTING